MKKKIIIALIGFLSQIFVACSPVAPVEKVQPASISISSQSSPLRLKPELFGSNIQWENRGDGILTTDHKLHAEALQLSKQSGISLLRFPGGSLSDTYDWSHGIGPVSKRSYGVSFSGTEVASDFGTQELINLAHELGTGLVLTINFNWSDQHALQWIDYIERQIEEKTVAAHYWEIGNEIYAPHENGHTTAGLYARRANQFARAIKGKNSHLKVGAVLEASFLQAAWMGNTYPHMTTWNEDVIKNLSRDIDFASIHFYAPYDKVWDNHKLARLTLAGPIVFRQNVQIIQKLLSKHKRTDINLAVTEYNTFFGDNLKLDSRTAGPEAALFSAMMLFEMARIPEITLANHWSLLNNSVFGLIETVGDTRTRPAYDVFKSLGAQKNNQILSHSVSCPRYTVHAKGNIPSLDVPLLAALVTSDNKGRLYINLVNRSPDTALNLKLDNSRYKTALLSQWAGESTDHWYQNSSQRTVAAKKDGFVFRLPPFSFSVIRLE